MSPEVTPEPSVGSGLSDSPRNWARIEDVIQIGGEWNATKAMVERLFAERELLEARGEVEQIEGPPTADGFRTYSPGELTVTLRFAALGGSA